MGRLALSQGRPGHPPQTRVSVRSLVAPAVGLDRCGNQVVICGRREDRLAEARRHSPGIVTRVCDLADAGQRGELADWLLDHHC